MEIVTPRTAEPPYRDRKRYAWLLSLLVPCNVAIGPAMHFPPLWRYVMDERLLAVVGRDAARINIDPHRRAAVIRKYGLADSAAPPTVT